MRRRVLVLCCLLLSPLSAGADADGLPVDHRGWGYLVDKLVADGVDPKRVELVFHDSRLPPFTWLEFSPSPRESHALYRGFLRPASIAAARRCRAEYAARLAEAERTHGVAPGLVAAILHVETGCGRNTGSSMVFHRLARLAMANEPRNVRDNVARLAEPGESELEERVRARARYLEDTFYPEVRATFELAGSLGVHPLDLRGSSSGAIGVPQFLPTSYLRYGTDADGDGRVDLYDPADATASCAHYLAAHGWRPGLSVAERRAVIWRYNRSDAYVDTVLALARQLDAPVGAARRRPTVRKAPVRRAPKPAARVAKPAGRAGQPASPPAAASDG